MAEASRRQMIAVEDKSFRAETVALDDKLFLRCRFDNCVLAYDGGYYGWQNCVFIGFCPLQFGENAQRVIQLLDACGLIRTERQMGVPGSVVPPTTPIA